MMNTPADQTESRARSALRCAKRVLIKAGTSVVANADGSPSLTRLGAIVEQIAELNQAGVEVIFVSSGAVGMGKNLLRKQARLMMSFKDLQKGGANRAGDGAAATGLVTSMENRMKPSRSIGDLQSIAEQEIMQASCAKSYAAAGQYELINLYQSLLSPKGITASQILLTQADFRNEYHLKNLRYAVERLLSLGIIPIINENDAVSVVQCCEFGKAIFTDNDSLAALCARSFGAEVLVLLTDVDGVYDKPPSNPKAKIIPFYHSDSNVSIGEKSSQGRGGMAAKIEAAISAVRPGSSCAACVVAAGSDLNAIRSILSTTYKNKEVGFTGKGTLFVTPGSDLEKIAMEELVTAVEVRLLCMYRFWEYSCLWMPRTNNLLLFSLFCQHGTQDEDSCSELNRDMATKARKEARKLMALPHPVRKNILLAVADALVERRNDILDANQLDLGAAAENNTPLPLVKRLKLTPQKLSDLETGIRQLAEMDDYLGVIKARRELADGLELTLTTVPIGVLMIIFESCPDSLPQIASLALASGNGLLLKGGKEAANSNSMLHEVIGDAIERGSFGEISRDIVALVTTRRQVKDLLALDDTIDLVIPRGSNSLVSYVKANTRIPVLGQADGVCHVYVDKSANDEMASKIVVDSKADYPSNAMETLLLHKDTLENNVALHVLQALRSSGVRCLGGPKAMQHGLSDVPAKSMKHEYGDMTCLVEIVEDLDEAIEWIHKNGSGHTEAIVCADDSPAGEEFLQRVDAACVFKNTSTRFADGYRFGLGAEVGISTGRIHARGPVGVEGLLTTKWLLRSSKGCNLASEFTGETPTKQFTHKDLALG